MSASSKSLNPSLSSSTSDSSATQQLQRGLGGIDATALVVGTVIGTGVFLKTTPMAKLLGSPGMVFAAWVAAGLLSLMGALVYAELGALFPEAGGEFVYLQRGYGNGFAFLYGWQRFWIGGPGSIAAYAVGAATFAKGILPLDESGQKAAALAVIALFTGLNCLTVSFGGRVQSFLTALKMILVVGLAIAALSFSGSGSWAHLSEGDPSKPWTLGSFGVAMIAALWAFDGWNNLPMAAGEVRRPEKNVPWALVGGTLLVLGIYALANLGYFYALPFTTIVEPGELSVAAKAAETFMGTGGILFLSVAFVISAVGAMNGSILTGARVPYAMAHEGLLPKFIGALSSRTQVPMASLLVQGVWASILALSGTFETLTDWVVFSAWIFYGLCGFAVIRLRQKAPHLPRSYRTPFYPVLPFLFCALSGALLVNSLIEMPKQSGFGLLFILSGLPVYFWMNSRKRKAELKG
jgi:APA family basic amino acid/polyamine antiporter